MNASADALSTPRQRHAWASYDDAAIAAAATIVAREVADWYRGAMPDEFARIDAAITDWRRSLS